MKPGAPAIRVLENRHGDRVELLELGARIRSLSLNLPGGPRNVVLSYPDVEQYRTDRYYLGGTIGRYANRLGNARFEIDGERFALTPSEGRHQLHGGPRGFDKRRFSVRAEPETNEASVDFELTSADGDQGYPGTLRVTVSYALNDARELEIRYRAVTDRPTPVSLTNHAYFNLDGAGGTIHGHGLEICADTFLETTADKIPSGRPVPVADTPFDLRHKGKLGELLDSTHPLIHRDRGPDICYVLAGRPAATLTSAGGDVRLAISTSYPGLQLYAGQYLEQPFEAYGGLCLEPQRLPDAPNHPGFPSAILRPGEIYDEWIRLAFTAGTNSGPIATAGTTRPRRP